MSTDVLELQRLQSAYADVVTRRAWSELDRLFLPDIVVEVATVSAPARSFTGPAEFVGFVSAACERFDHFGFVILNSVVEVTGDNAKARIFMCEIRHHTAEDEWSTAYGVYSDTYRKVDGTWWFAERHYRSLARTGPQAGIFGVPADLPPIGR
ncbi:MAG TPA: nuclear transport factor 2 family protein [Mycobacteriales bacterium]|nr:nuclear transport factor 2 family protein [Mycobacteriales bacterium]